jgi:translation initiation factor IF-3
LEILDRKSAKRLDKVRIVGKGVNEIIAIGDALSAAEDRGLDLVLVSEDVSPPVVRIQDSKKIEYEKKKARKKKQPTSALKEIRFLINISDHDLEIKTNKIGKFLEKGNKVKLSVRLKGREREKPERAQELIDKVASALPCKMVKVAGPMTMVILEPVKEKK